MSFLKGLMGKKGKGSESGKSADPPAAPAEPAIDKAALLEKKLRGIAAKETYLRDATFPCPECGGLVKRYRSSTVSNAIDAFACTQCLWFAPACGSHGCEGYMGGYMMQGYETSARWTCTTCSWSGVGYLMVAPGLPFGCSISVNRNNAKTPETVYDQIS